MFTVTGDHHITDCSQAIDPCHTILQGLFIGQTTNISTIALVDSKNS